MNGRRAILLLPMYLALGFILNMLIAWACALGSPQSETRNPLGLTNYEVRRWIDRSPWPFKLRPGPTLSSSSIGLEYDLLESGEDRPYFWHTARAVRAGFPLPSLTGERWSNLDINTPPEHRHIFVGALDPASLGFSGEAYAIRLLPYRPILPGALTNTIFYAGLLWLACSAIRWGRNCLRWRHHRCPECNITFPENDRITCPACGWRKGITNARRPAPPDRS